MPPPAGLFGPAPLPWLKTSRGRRRVGCLCPRVSLLEI